MIAYLKEHGLKSYKADVKIAPKIFKRSDWLQQHISVAAGSLES